MEKRIANKRHFRNERLRLLTLAKHADLFNPKQVSDVINNQKKKNMDKPTSNGYKICLFQVYATFCKDNQIPFDRPKLKASYPIPLIPTTANVEKIINNASRTYATIFKIMVETAVEGQELRNTHRNQIDPEQGTISISGCKGHTNGIYKLKTQTAEMLRQYVAKHQDPHPFPESRNMGMAWNNTRRKTAKKLCDPELFKIPLKSLRNYAGATFYYGRGNKDPIATQRFMRHRRLDTTQHYLQGIITPEDEEYTTKTVQLGIPTTVKEITEISDAGYQYYTEADGYKIFRKRK